MSEFTTYPYVADGDQRQQLDVFAPEEAASLRTAVVVIHGGAFRHGDRSAVHARCRALAARGMTAIAVGYRLLDTDEWPAPLEDIRTAVRWVHDNSAEIGVEANRIVLQGHSAGAQLALLTARSAGVPVAGVLAYFAPAGVALTPGPGVLPAQMILGPGATEEAADALSPLAAVGPSFPPTLLIHGAADRFIPAIASLRLFEALTAAGVRTSLQIVAGADHEFDLTPRYTEATSDAAVAFVLAEIVEAEQAAKEALESNPFVSMPPPGPPPA